jgi:flagellar biosynthesis/type III secretory pathway protein FliH
MSRIFSVMGDDLYFDGQRIATFNPTAWGSLRDEVETFLNGLPCDVTPNADVERERKEMEDEHANELQAAYEDGRAEGLGEGYDKGYSEGYAVGARNTGAGE